MNTTPTSLPPDALPVEAEDAWGDDEDGDRLERLSHLVGGMLESLQVAMAAGDRIAAELGKHRTGAAHVAR